MRLSKLGRPGMASYLAQRVCTWHPLRSVVASLIATSRPQTSTPDLPDRAIALNEDLKRDGIAMLPQFVDRAAVERIKQHVAGLPLRERFPPYRAGFSLENAPPNVHVAEYPTESLLGCADVVAIANHPELLGAAALYLGCKPTISNVSVWWSLPADGTAQAAENYHRDVDDWRFVKFFLYLTDVDEECGPHCFVRGSHRSQRFLLIRRIEDGEVADRFSPASRLSICGKSGDAFLEDTFGLHKGQPPRRARRLLLQVEYSINPIAVYDYSPQLPALDVEVDAYINRLYVRGSSAKP